MSKTLDQAEPKFRYLRLSDQQKADILKSLRRRLEDAEAIVFAYVHGSFLERSTFRDLDVAVWIRDPSEAFRYTVDFSAELEVEIGIPVDVQALNEAPLPFKYHVFIKGKLLLSRDEALRSRLVDEAVRQYIDLKQLQEVSARV